MANANNQNGNAGLGYHTNVNHTDVNGNYENSNYRNMHNPNSNPQMMGWMPQPGMQQPMMMMPQPNHNYGMGWMPQPGMLQQPMMMMPQPNQQYGMGMGWMPPPGMQPYPPPNQQYGLGMGWMPQPGMQQPMMMLPPPAFNNHGFAPSHNGNIQDVVQINELEEENKDSIPIKNIAGATNVDANAEYSDNDVVNVINILEPNSKKQAKKPNHTVSTQEVVKRQDHKQDNQLANLFDNALDNNMQRDNPRGDNHNEFGQESNESNVIMGLIPIDKQQTHFDNVRFPNEMYNVTMINNDVAKLPAKDISSNALETCKIVYEHNNQLATSGQPSAGKAFIYARSSRTNDISIETQHKACLEYSAVHRLALLPFGYQSDNNISARNMGNLKHELGFWKNYIPDNSHIIIYSVDRLSRHLVMGMQFLDEMATRGIRIHFITHELVFHAGISAAGRAMVQQELQSAEKFSNIASEKIRTTIHRLRKEGHVFGRAPYGYKHTLIGTIRKRIQNNKEQVNITLIQTQHSYIIENWENNPDTVNLRYTKINMLRALVRWCNRKGMKYRNQTNYTTLQLRTILQIKV